MSVTPFKPRRTSGRRRARGGAAAIRGLDRLAGAGLAALVALLLVANPQWLEALVTAGVEIGASAPSAPSLDAAGAVVTGRPSRITDGDTLRFGDTRVRLAGIDAPEMSTSDGEQARAHLIDLIDGAQVRCEDTGERSYDRIVATCFVGEDDLAAAMVRDGWARDWARYSGGRYAGLEQAAIRNGRGMHGG